MRHMGQPLTVASRRPVRNCLGPARLDRGRAISRRGICSAGGGRVAAVQRRACFGAVSPVRLSCIPARQLQPAEPPPPPRLQSLPGRPQLIRTPAQMATAQPPGQPQPGRSDPPSRADQPGLRSAGLACACRPGLRSADLACAVPAWPVQYRPGSRSIETGVPLGHCSVAAQLLQGSPCPVSLVSAYFVAGLG